VRAYAGRHHKRATPPAVPAAVPAAAPAAPEPPPDPADALLEEARRLFSDDADYEGALSRFQESYRMRPSWRALSGVALVYQQQGKYVEAMDTYEQLLLEFGATLNETQMATVRKRMNELEQRVSTVELRMAQPDAVVYIDGHEVSRGAATARVRVLPGPHTLVATLVRHETLTQRIEAHPGSATPVEVRLPAERVKVVVQKQRLERPYPTWVPWMTMGGGVALALVGGGLHIAAAQDFDAFDAKVAAEVQPNGPAAAVDESLRHSGERKQVAAISLYAVGGAAVATGMVLLFFNRPQPVETGATTAQVFFDGSSFGVAGTF
jgi:hypothetical protein